MDNDILGISAHFDVSEIVTGFNTLIDLLEKAGTVSDEMADEITRALTAIQYNLSNGLTAEGMEELINQLDKVKGKVVEASNAFANGTSNLDFSQFHDMVANYQQVTAAVFSATQSAYMSEAENVQRLEAELQELINRREEMAAMGSDEDFEKVGKAVFDVSQKVAEGKERMAEYAQAMKTAQEEADNATEAMNGISRVVSAMEVGTAFRDLGSAVKEAGQEVGNWLTGNGKFQESVKGMKDAIDLLPAPISQSIEATKKFTMAMWQMVKTPLGAVLAVIVVALQAVKKWFDKSAEGQKAFAKISSFVGSILESLTDVLVKVGDYLFNAFTDATGPMNAFAKGLVTTLKHAVKAASNMLGGLGDILKSIGQAFSGDFDKAGETFLRGWNGVKKAFSEAGEGFISALGTVYDGVRGVVRMGADLGTKLFNTNLESVAKSILGSAMKSAELTDQEQENTDKLLQTRGEIAKKDAQIEKTRENIANLSGKEKEAEIEKLKALQAEKFDEEIKARKDALRIMQERHKLHSTTLQDLDKEQMLTNEILILEQRKAQELRKNAYMQAAAEKETERAATKAKNKQEREARQVAKAETAEAKRDARQSEAERDATGKYEDIAYKNAVDAAAEAAKLDERIADARLAAMEEGGTKILAQREHQFKKELDAIAREQQQAVEAERKRQKAEFDAAQEIVKARGGKPRNWQESDLDMTAVNAIMEKYNEIAKLTEQKQQNQVKQGLINSMDAYIAKYGDYEARRAIIIQQFEKKISDARAINDEWAAKSAEQEREAALHKLDADFGLTTQEMADLFADASDKSVKSINAIIEKYEALIQFMQGKNGTIYDKNGKAVVDDIAVSRDDLLNLGFTDEEIAKVQNGEIKINDLTAALAKLKGELSKRSPFQAFTDELDKAVNKVKVGDIGEGIQGIGNAVNKFLPKVKKFGADIANIFGFEDDKVQSVIDGVGGLAETAVGVGQIYSGDIVGGVSSMVGGISKVVTAFEGLFGADYSSYNKLVEQYDRLTQVWDELIDKKKEYLSTSYGGEALKAEKEATEILNKETDAWRELGRERLNAGASVGSHSIGVRMTKEMTQGDWSDLSKALGGNARNILGDRLTGLFSLSSEQLQRLKENAPAFWAKMDDDVKKYLQNIIDGAERLEDIQKTAKERLTQTTFDTMRDNFVSSLSDMEKSAAAFSNDFSKMLFNAMLNTQVDALLSDRLDDWYNQFADAMKDGTITDAERSALLNDYNAIVADGLELRDMLAEATGYSSGSSSEGNGAFKAASSFSQEQGDELNGRLTSLQIGQQQGIAQRAAMIETMGDMTISVSNIQEYTRRLAVEVKDMRDMQFDSLRRLTEISVFTSVLPHMADTMDNVDRILNTKL